MEQTISPFQKALIDPRWLQLFLLSNFLIYGWIFLDWYSHVEIYAAAFVSCLGTQFFWAKIKHLPKGSWKSALISALGLCLLLRVNAWEIMMLAGILTISSKFIFRVRSKHIFNPTNFGIIVVILFGMGWISPGQWGSSEVVFGLALTGAALVLFGINRWDVALSFLIALFVFEAIRTVGYLGWGWDVLFHKFNSGTILLFTFFMITDPKTSPGSRKGRVLWGIMIAGLSFCLSQIFYFYQAPLIALFVVSLCTPLLDAKFRHSKFQWNYQLNKR